VNNVAPDIGVTLFSFWKFKKKYFYSGYITATTMPVYSTGTYWSITTK